MFGRRRKKKNQGDTKGAISKKFLKYNNHRDCAKDGKIEKLQKLLNCCQ